jgi:hypothetical protein
MLPKCKYNNYGNCLIFPTYVYCENDCSEYQRDEDTCDNE